MMEKSVWRTSGHGSSPSRGDESEERNRASFPRRGKRSVISNHFTDVINNHKYLNSNSGFFQKAFLVIIGET